MVAPKSRLFTAAAVFVLLTALVLQLSLSVKHLSQTWDEACHIYAGYSYWTRADYGINPEHPPLVKLLATIPLWNIPLHAPEPKNRYFKIEEFIDGKDFLYKNDADSILFRTRLAASLLTVLLAVLIFSAGREMFGTTTGLVALLLFVFEPNFLAHGALVTTDAGVACFMFAAVYAYYRYRKSPSVTGLMLVGLAAGLALASKHSAVISVPILIMLAVVSLRWKRTTVRHGLFRTVLDAVAVAVISFVVLWAFYGFRYAARPDNLTMNPPLSNVIDQSGKVPAILISAMARGHVLPESYLYGLADVTSVANETHTYLLGKVYLKHVWFYFPTVFLIKTTLPLLVLLLLVPITLWKRWLNVSPQVLFLALPVLVFFPVAVVFGPNLGIRHLLPCYPFLLILASAAVVSVGQRHQLWMYPIATLVLMHAFSSLMSFPDYIAYSNEFWGGPSKTYNYLGDSNVDWAQQLKETHLFLDSHGIKRCWFAYFGEGIIDRNYYGVRCEQLPTIGSQTSFEADLPVAIDGTVLISAATLAGPEFYPYEDNPYAEFRNLRPAAKIGGGILVYQGHFDIPYISAIAHARRAEAFLDMNRPVEALSEAQFANALAPDCYEVKAAVKRAIRTAKAQSP